MTMKLIDEVFDPKNKLRKFKEKPRLALELTPTRLHNPSHDLFRIYTFKLLKGLSKNYELIIIYRDLQASLDLTFEESKKFTQESIGFFRNAKIDFKVFYESEILQKYLVNMPEDFFLHLYKNILHKDHTHFSQPLMYSSVTKSVLLPILKALKIDVLLCMHDEKEEFDIICKMKGFDVNTLPVIFYRSFPDLTNKKHSPKDKKRIFPEIGWDSKKIYSNFKKYKTNLETLKEWYRKLNLENEEFFNLGNKKINFLELIKKKNYDDVLKLVSEHLAYFLEKEKEFLEIASKEVKLSLNELKSKEILDCLNVSARIKILNVLSKKNLPALDISESVNVNLPTTLFHLNKLLKANIISRDNSKIYHLNINRFVLHV